MFELKPYEQRNVYCTTYQLVQYFFHPPALQVGSGTVSYW